jgi:hypothetical protein
MTAAKTYAVNSNSTSINGTQYLGYVTITYDELVKTLGQPKEGSADGKTTCEWHVEFEDGSVATVYDWKVGYTPKNLHDWHVGGRSGIALDYLEEVLEKQITRSKY